MLLDVGVCGGAGSKVSKVGVFSRMEEGELAGKATTAHGIGPGHSWLQRLHTMEAAPCLAC